MERNVTIQFTVPSLFVLWFISLIYKKCCHLAINFEHLIWITNLVHNVQYSFQDLLACTSMGYVYAHIDTCAQMATLMPVCSTPPYHY